MNNLIGTNDIKNELSKNFIEYAVACNTDRAIPDAKSGLKPVAKRILWGAYENGYSSSKAHVKAAKIVGDVMGNYHPHGDSSIYGALVRLSQEWIMRYPLLDFHGNKGNIAGDGAASMRYTEARLSKLTEAGLLNGIKKRNVDFIPNYDETLDEPVTLPAIFPNLLCNPNTGIGVAMACNWLPHNLGEVAQAIYDYMDGKEPSIPAPDFPTGGVIINSKACPGFIKTGHGSVKVRGKYEIVKNKIIFTEIPYGVNTETLLEQIGDVSDKGEIEGIKDVRDESNKKGLRLVIECANNANPEAIVLKLFSKTHLQTSISYNQVALIDKTPTDLGLVDCIKIYIDHNVTCLKKECEFDLQKAKDRLHIVDGLLIALEDIDNVIALIKGSADSTAARIALMEKYKLTEIQAKSILAMRLSSLAHMEKIELENEKKELLSSIEDLEDIIASSERQLSIIRERLEAIVKKFGDKRRTELVDIDIKPEEKEIAEVIPEDVVVVMTGAGNLKRIPKKSFRTQKRNGKGIKNEDDTILESISTNTIDTMMFFTNLGKMYRLVVDNIPETTNAGKGMYVGSLVNLEKDEKVIAMTSLHRNSTANHVVFITKQGMIKKTLLEEYTKVKRSTGIQAIKLKEGDSIATVTFLNEEELILISKDGMSIHFATEDIAPIGRVASGVKSIKLNEGDYVLTALPVHKETDFVALFTSGGYGKKVPISEFPIQGRVGKGVYAYKLDKALGELVGAAMVSDEDNMLVMGKPNSICFSSTEIPVVGRTGQGNMMIKNSSVVKVVKL